MEREWSCYRGGQFNGGRMIVREVISFMEGEWSFYRGAQWRENGHLIEMVSFMEGE